MSVPNLVHTTRLSVAMSVLRSYHLDTLWNDHAFLPSSRNWETNMKDHRALISWFVDAMVAKLDANDHKGHWENSSLQYLCTRLAQEKKELSSAIAQDLTPEEIIAECADVANFAMMIAEVYKNEYAERVDPCNKRSLSNECLVCGAKPMFYCKKYGGERYKGRNQ